MNKNKAKVKHVGFRIKALCGRETMHGSKPKHKNVWNQIGDLFNSRQEAGTAVQRLIARGHKTKFHVEGVRVNIEPVEYCGDIFGGDKKRKVLA